MVAFVGLSWVFYFVGGGCWWVCCVLGLGLTALYVLLAMMFGLVGLLGCLWVDLCVGGI